MIRSFRSKALRRFAETGDESKLPVRGASTIDRLADQLFTLNIAVSPMQMNVPGWYFHSLQGKPMRYSVRVTGNSRLTFGFEPPDAEDVDLEDYH